ncbi:hypothetical protein [Paenirhodobacter populi]|uniref:hypothetical protein n=1 Tax=Paenirhodobacter populi TaxID=2306993 RepID=UPI000FE3CDF1|nr:hypothetical protein [Sinirhodobacter populi]
MGRVHLDYISGRDRKVWFWFKQWGHGAQGHALEQACNPCERYRLHPPASARSSGDAHCVRHKPRQMRCCAVGPVGHILEAGS